MNPPAVTGHPQQIRRILARGVNWIGDSIMTTPAMMRMRERFPEAHIALLAPEKLGELWLHHPAVNEIISCPAGQGLFSVARALRAGNFELALILPNSPRSALETWLARIPERVGYARRWRNWFLTRAVPTRPGHTPTVKRSAREIRDLVGGATLGTRIVNRQSSIANPPVHQIHEYLQLVATLGASPEPVAPQLFVTPGEVEAARDKFGLSGTKEPVFGLNPGAEYGPAKRWPLERFIAAARDIQTRTHCVWLIFGGKSDVAAGERLHLALGASRSASQNLAGRTSLRELCALLKTCRVLLTNDSGPMHAAAALGTPVVAPFGSTSPELTGPGLPGDPRHHLLKSDAPCSPCFLRRCPIDFRCMNGIAGDRVVGAVLEAASENS